MTSCTSSSCVWPLMLIVAAVVVGGILLAAWLLWPEPRPRPRLRRRRAALWLSCPDRECWAKFRGQP
jgi:hypothetical protein